MDMVRQVVHPRGDKNTGPAQEVVVSLFFSLSFILVNLRFYVRARMVKKLWWDDFFLLLGLLFTIVSLGLFIARINSGFGRHIYYLSSQQISFALKLLYIGLPFFMLSCMFTRISICLFLLRIFRTNLAWKRALYVIMAFIVATGTSSAIITLPQCNPVTKVWNTTINGTCWSQETRVQSYRFQGGVSIAADFLLAFLPIYFLKDVQISIRTKYSICALMSLGIFTGICAVIRTAFASEFASSDITYSTTSEIIWAGLEMNVATIAAAIPALRPLWAKSAYQNQRNRGQVQRPDDKHLLKPTHVIMDQQIRAGPLPSHLETQITFQEGRNQRNVGNGVGSLPDCTGIVKTTDISLENFRNVEGRWISENSSHSEGERNGEDAV